MEEDKKREENEEKVVEIVENVKEDTKKEEKKKIEVTEDRKGLAIASMILGIISIVLCCAYGISIICAILAIVFGIISIKSSGKGMAISGIITGTIGIIITIAIFIFLFLVGFSTAIFDNGVLEYNSDAWNESNYDSNYEYYYEVDDNEYRNNEDFKL